MSTAATTIATIARAQHGAFSLRQAREAGFTDRQVERRVDDGRWERIGRGVLAIAGSPPSWLRTAIVPQLQQPRAVLADLAAGHLLGLVEAPVERPTVILPPGSSARLPGASLVRRIELPVEHLAVVDGLRATSPARTLVDLTSILPSRTIVRTVDEAMHRRITTVALVDAAVAIAPGRSRAHRAALLDALDAWRGIRPGSAGEVRLLRQLREWGIEDPARQAPILDRTGETIGRADLAWCSVRYGLEYDGDEHHGPNRWAHDEHRHARILAAGWRLGRVGARDLLPSSDLRRRLTRALRAAA